MLYISEVLVGSGGTSAIAFTSIPQTFTDLKLVLSLRSNRSSTGDYGLISFNSATANSAIQLWNSGNSFIDATTTNTVMVTPDSTSLSGAFSNVEIYLSNYTSSTTKLATVDAVAEDNIVGVQGVSMGMLLWNSGSAATGGITSISIAPRFGSLWAQYSYATLYGIKNS